MSCTRIDVNTCELTEFRTKANKRGLDVNRPVARLAPVTVHAFIDESKAGGYYLAAALFRPHRLRQARREMRALCLPG